MIRNVAIALVLLAAAGLAGFYLGRGQREVVVEERIVEKRGETVTKYVDRVVTVTKIIRPDGTVEETTKTEDRAGSSESRSSERDSSNSSKTKSLASNYSVGAKYWITSVSAMSRPELQQIEVTAGRRILGDIWADIGVRTDSVAVGVSLKF